MQWLDQQVERLKAKGGNGTQSYLRLASAVEGIMSEEIVSLAEEIGAGRLDERTARYLIGAGYVTPDSEITDQGLVLIPDEGREGSPCDANPEARYIPGEKGA